MRIEREGNRNIRVYAHSGRSQYIQYYYGCYDPLQYPLLFPHGDIGWHEGIQRVSSREHFGTTGSSQSVNINPNNINSIDELIQAEECVFTEGRKRTSVSCREYYAYKFQVRLGDKSLLLHTGRLLQQFIVDTYIKIETQRLDYFRKKQQESRSETYQGLVDSVETGATVGADVGRRVILPVSFIGGPRDMRRRYMDAMSLVQRFGKPDLFITVTCNPNWPEIKELLKYVDEPQNRPDLLARVFHARLEELKNDIFKRHIFGEVAAYAYVIAFQKRGLPHAHFLIILKSKFKITTPAHCDRFISAEIPNKESEPHLYNLVKKHMIHGPCGSLNLNCACMLHNQQEVAPSCKNKYPRSFNDETTFDENSYPIYRRRDTSAYVVVRGHQLDNRWVVPFNPYLLAKFDCHINVEVCAGIRCVKYIYKYIYKGHDRISLSLYAGADVHEFDEIKEYQSARWVSPPEAAWRIYAFPIAEIKPAVVHLQVHLQNYQYLNFHGNDRLVNIVEDEFASHTMLTQFFYMNCVDEVAKKLNFLYIQFPEYFVWNNQKKLWTQRKKKEVIGRLVTVNPTEGERYYLRLLLMNVRTPKSFDNLKTVNGHQAVTFREAAENLGLLSGDHIVEKCLDEAVLYQMPSSFRRLFATLLIFCDISNPRNLWNKFKSYMCEDLLRTKLHTDDEVQVMVLQLIANAVEKMGKKIDDFNLVDNRLSLSTQEKEDREIAAE